MTRGGGPVLIEAALNGVTRPERNAAVPRLPEEVARDALASMAAGAAIVHTHCHDPALPPEEAAATYLAAYRPILDERPDAILYPTVGFGGDLEQRFGHLAPLAEAEAIRAAVLDPGSVNLGASGPDGLPGPVDFVYSNDGASIRYAVELCRRHGLGPSVAVFEPGFLRVVLAAQRAGSLPPGTLVKFYFSASGLLGGGEPAFSPPPIPEALALYLAMLGDAPLPWAVALLGGSLLDSPLAPLALERGGHLRVGLEDDMDGPSNPRQVERAVALCTEHGRAVAGPAEAAKLLGLPRH